MDFLFGLCVGLLLGGIGAHLYAKKESERSQKMLEDSFAALSDKHLRESIPEVLKIAQDKLSQHLKMGEKDLDNKKGLIDGTLKDMKDNMTKVERLMQQIGHERSKQFGEIGERLNKAAQVTRDLETTTRSLSEALKNTKKRGQWGERMAEDILRFSGFIEGVNYYRERKMDIGSSRPDFTFLLPQNLKLNMDAKFPFANYEKFISAQNAMEKDQYQKNFLKDVRDRIKEVQGRNYINSEENTVDYMLLFIPNESIYAFINEIGREIVDEALQKKIILCSPLSLYAILAIIRQSIDNFHLEAKSKEMLSYFGTFKKQWEMFKESMEKMGRRIDESQKEYHKLINTRTNQLEKPLQKIEQMRTDSNIPVASLPEQKPTIPTPPSEQISFG